MLTHWLLTGIIAKVADVVQGGKSKFRAKKSASVQVSKPQLASIKTRQVDRVEVPELPVTTASLALKAQLPSVSVSAVHIEPVSAAIRLSAAVASVKLSASHEARSQIERYLESYGVQDFRSVAKRILAALKARSVNETPKAIIRDVLSQAGIADRQLQLLTSLIFVAWSARRTIHLEAA